MYSCYSAGISSGLSPELRRLFVVGDTISSVVDGVIAAVELCSDFKAVLDAVAVVLPFPLLAAPL